jgi:hypothetical protein
MFLNLMRCVVTVRRLSILIFVFAGQLSRSGDGGGRARGAWRTGRPGGPAAGGRTEAPVRYRARELHLFCVASVLLYCGGIRWVPLT